MAKREGGSTWLNMIRILVLERRGKSCTGLSLLPYLLYQHSGEGTIDHSIELHRPEQSLIT